MPAAQQLPLWAVLAFEGARVYQAWTKEPTVCPAAVTVRGCVVDDFEHFLQKADTCSAHVVVEGIPVNQTIVKEEPSWWTNRAIVTCEVWVWISLLELGRHVPCSCPRRAAVAPSRRGGGMVA